MVFKEIRLVAIRYPATSWGIQIDPTEQPEIVARGQPSYFSFFHVGPMRGEPYKRMIYEPVLWPEYNTLENWAIFKHDLSLAMLKEPLYREDFENINL